MWPAGAAWRLGARGPGTCSAQAPGSCASPTARVVSRPPLGPRARASAARAVPPCGAARDCVPASRWKMSAKRRVSTAFSTTHSPSFFSSPHSTWAPFWNQVTLFRDLGTPESSPGTLDTPSRKLGNDADLGPCTPRPAPAPLTGVNSLQRSNHLLRETKHPRLLSSPACALQPPSLFPALLSPQRETPHPFLMLAVPSHLFP